VHRRRLLLQMSHTVWPVSVYIVLGTWISNAKTAELIKMPFGRQTRISPRNHTISWGSRHLKGKGHFWGDLFRPTVTYPRKSALIVCRRWQTCLPSALSRRMHSPSRGVTGWQCNLLPNYIGRHLFCFSNPKGKPLCDFTLFEPSHDWPAEVLPRKPIS